MEKKIDLESLKEILREHVPDETQAEILRGVQEALYKKSEEKETVEKEKIEKKSIVILTTLPQRLERDNLSELTGFFTEIPLEDPLHSLREKIQNIHSAYSQSRKAKKNPARTLGDLLELSSGKLLKENGILKKPKDSVQFVYIDNKLQKPL